MMKSIAVTGSPGTGKTTLAKAIADVHGMKYVDVNSVIRREKLSEGYDRKRKCKIIDVKRLVKVLIGIIKDNEGVVIDSHLSHYIPSRYVDICIVTKCDLKKLKSRLRKRGYSADKIEENMEAEIFDICLNEAKEKGHKILVVDTSRRIPKKVVEKMISV